MAILSRMVTGVSYDIAELARLSGLTVRTIRYYLQQRLLSSSGLRGPGARYVEAHLARLRQIRRLQAEHLPLAEIRRRLEKPDSSRAARPIATRHEAAVRSHWERMSLTTDVELHVRRPLSRIDNRSVERLLEQARLILNQEQAGDDGSNLTTPRLLEEHGIVLLAEGGLVGLAEAVVPHLVAADAELFEGLSVGEGGVPVPGGSAVLSPGEEEALASEGAQRAPRAGVRIVLTRRRLADNWFSHWHAGVRTAVVSLADWEGAFEVSPLAFVAFEIAHHSVRVIAPDFDPVQLAHAETRGCLFDFCETRADIEVKLQAADLCPACRSQLESAGLPLPRFLRLAEAIRSLAINPPSAVH